MDLAEFVTQSPQARRRGGWIADVGTVEKAVNAIQVETKCIFADRYWASMNTGFRETTVAVLVKYSSTEPSWYPD